jgi:Ca2+-binding RTX toxin-like protein
MRLVFLAAVVAAGFLGHTATADAYQCYDVKATIVGTAGSDKLHGTNGRDVIVGLGGDDVIWGFDDSDRLCGNGGNDKLIAGAGVDQVDGGTGHNVLKGGSGDDRLYGGPSADSFWPGLGNDVVDGRGTPDREWVHYDYAKEGVSIDLDTGHVTGEGTDILVAIRDIVGSRFADVIKGDEYDNVFRLGKGNDRGVGRGANDSLSGGPGNDDLDGGSGTNENDGGDGADSCVNPQPGVGAQHCESP